MQKIADHCPWPNLSRVGCNPEITGRLLRRSRDAHLPVRQLGLNHKRILSLHVLILFVVHLIHKIGVVHWKRRPFETPPPPPPPNFQIRSPLVASITTWGLHVDKQQQKFWSYSCDDECQSDCSLLQQHRLILSDDLSNTLDQLLK